MIFSLHVDNILFVVCTELSDPEGGTVNYTMKSIGSSAEYRCMSSHLQLSTSDTTRTCTNTGWSGEAPFCSKPNIMNLYLHTQIVLVYIVYLYSL